MNWIVLAWALTTSYLPVNTQAIVYPTGLDAVGALDSFSVKMEVSARAFNHLRAWGSMEAYESATENLWLGFKPYRSDFIAGIAIYSKGIELGMTHECDHGIESDVGYEPWFWGSRMAIYLRLSGETTW
jgi:hypothetical protein